MKNEDLQFVLCPSRFSSNPELYETIYRFWHKTWSATFLELENSAELPSDNFSRQDWVCAIFYKGECTAVSTFRHFDLGSEVAMNDSYFSNWNAKAIKDLRKKGRFAMACCYFGVAPHFRSKTLGFSMKELLMGFVTEVFLWSTADCMTGAVRKCKNVHGSAYSWGAEQIAENVPSGHGSAVVDLVTFSHGMVAERKKQNLLTPLVESLWRDLYEITKAERPLVLTEESTNTSFDLAS